MLKEKIQGFIAKKTEGNAKRKTENLIAFLIILIVTIVAINMIWKEDKKEAKQEENANTYKTLASVEETHNTENTENDLEKRLEAILGKINGVGEVKVLITYSESNKTVAMYNENLKQSSTEENDTSGGTRKITETDTSKEIIYKEENGEKVPITEQIIMAKIEGAVITAKGAGNANVKANIIQAVEAATGIPTHKIQVFEMN